MTPKRPKPRSGKPMTCVACDFNQAALSDCSDQLQAALAENLRLKKWADECHESNSAFTENFTRMTIEICELKQDLKHSDAERRMLQRDILAQQEILKRFAPFHVVSPDLQKGQ